MFYPLIFTNKILTNFHECLSTNFHELNMHKSLVLIREKIRVIRGKNFKINAAAHIVFADQQHLPDEDQHLRL